MIQSGDKIVNRFLDFRSCDRTEKLMWRRRHHHLLRVTVSQCASSAARSVQEMDVGRRIPQ